ncbi:hypothetical protein HMPREF1569_3500 [Klebsiella oxytoca OK-1]|nr:hypothetical protein HMPREF1569_3500 [Klebsiella oxytoca OK-1]
MTSGIFKKKLTRLIFSQIASRKEIIAWFLNKNEPQGPVFAVL